MSVSFWSNLRIQWARLTLLCLSDAVLNHSMSLRNGGSPADSADRRDCAEAGADFTEPFNVIEVAEDDRTKEISGVVSLHLIGSAPSR